jgi:orotidine-5'-phosphate decarboxylase
VRRAIGSGLELLIPGIRFEGSATHDQARVVTPAAAVRSGATYLVLGRMVTAAPDPREAMAAARAEIASASAA